MSAMLLCPQVLAPWCSDVGYVAYYKCTNFLVITTIWGSIYHPGHNLFVFRCSLFIFFCYLYTAKRCGAVPLDK